MQVQGEGMCYILAKDSKAVIEALDLSDLLVNSHGKWISEIKVHRVNISGSKAESTQLQVTILLAYSGTAICKSLQ